MSAEPDAKPEIQISTRALVEALQSNLQGTSCLMGLTAGTVLARDFFQAENLARMTAATG